MSSASRQPAPPIPQLHGAGDPASSPAIVAQAMAAALDTGRGDELDFTDYISRILPALLAAMSSTDADVVVAASNAATEIVKAVPDDTLMETTTEKKEER